MTPPPILGADAGGFDLGNPALQVALALGLGAAGQAAARHLRVPGIVVLLAIGIAAGPDGLDLVRPDRLGEALPLLVSFAVAIILFEGGMSLDLRRLREQARPIRRLVTVGALVTTIGGALAARFLLGWPWPLAMLFGTLVIVTGPTVIQPLLRRIRLERGTSTVLEGEGVFGDAIGALIAVLALELVLARTDDSWMIAAGGFLGRLGLGLVLGLVVGVAIAGALRADRLLPDELENVFVLALVLLAFQLSDALRSESGLVAVIVAGVVAGNVRSRSGAALREFKEQLTVLFVGMLFVLLAADVRWERVLELGVPGLLVVAALLFVVRPANVFLSTWGTGLDLRQKAFVSWLAPRGIVAAAVASFCAIELEAAGIGGGRDLQALVFLVITTTVVVQGLSGGTVARWLGLRPPPPSGAVVMGATALGRTLARAVRELGGGAQLVDSNPENCRAAERDGLPVILGSGLDERVLERARLEDRLAAIAVTSNEDANFAFARRCRQEAREIEVLVALRPGRRSVTPDMVRRMGGEVAFGEPRNLERWSRRMERRRVRVELLAYEGAGSEDELPLRLPKIPLLPLVGARKGRLLLPRRGLRLRSGDLFSFAMPDEHRDEVIGLLAERGFRPAESPRPGSPGGGSGAPAPRQERDERAARPR
jgi:NhaP-type Na+/H+ or K+/H+ antiporter